MFARTERLTLRPPWPEDAPALAAAIGHDSVARMLARIPWSHALADAQSWAAAPRGAHEPRFVIEAHGGPCPVLVGGIAIRDEPHGPHLGYWLTPSAWGRGYATEAGRAVIAMAHHLLPIARLHARHFADNPASGRVLRKLGFHASDASGRMPSAVRGGGVTDTGYVLDLGDRRGVPIAA